MTHTPDPSTNPTQEAVEAEAVGERPDLGRTRDALTEALSGTDSGSDTRAGSLEGGSSSGSDDGRDQDIINQALARKGKADAQAARASADPQSPSDVGPGAVPNAGEGHGGPNQAAAEDPAEGRRADDTDPAAR